MTDIPNKILALSRLAGFLDPANEQLDYYLASAANENAWFTPAFVRFSMDKLAGAFLQEQKLRDWLSAYPALPVPAPKTIGLTMAGNIPMVGFHDLLCVYMSGHRAKVKLSSKDAVLMRMLAERLAEYDPAFSAQIIFAEQLKACDAYIATGSNNTSRYFEAYFAGYPHIIRRNRTSVAVLDGSETREQLGALAVDVFAYFGLGCRNVTQIQVPRGYDFTLLLEAFEPYRHLIDHHRYRNNYDYYLAIYLLNKVPYLSNDFVLLVENALPFSAVSVLHYAYYDDKPALLAALQQDENVQCIVAPEAVPFGQAQSPALADYADGVDTMAFLSAL